MAAFVLVQRGFGLVGVNIVAVVKAGSHAAGGHRGLPRLAGLAALFFALEVFQALLFATLGFLLLVLFATLLGLGALGLVLALLLFAAFGLGRLGLGRLLGGLAATIAFDAVATTAAFATATAFGAFTALAAVRAVTALAAIIAAGLLAFFGRRRFVAGEQRRQAGEKAALGHRGLHGRGQRRRHRLRRFLAHRRRVRRAHGGHGRHVGNVDVRLGQRVHGQLARRGAVVAGTGAVFAKFVVAQAADVEVRGLELVVGDHHHRRVVPGLDLDQGAALFVEQVVGDFRRGLHQHLAGVFLHRVFFGQAQDRQRQRFDAAHAAMAFAARANHLAGLAQARAQALAAHFKQAEARDAADLDAGAVLLQGHLQALFDLALVLARGHVDEVDHHQAAQVAQAHLAGHFVGGLEVGVERGFFDVAALGGARRVDVDGRQGLGLVDHDRAARGQADLALVGTFDLRFDLVAVEQRGGVFVELELAQVLRHHRLHEVAGLVVHFLGIDQDLADVGAQVVAQGADDQARFLVDQERGRLGQRGVGDRLPDLQQVIEVPLQFVGGAADAGGADDHAHFLGNGQRVHRFLQGGAVVTLDPARHAAGGGRVGHQHHVAAGQGDERGQGGALVAAFFLFDLHDHFLAFAQEFLQAGLVRVDAGDEVVAGDFLERQEAVALAAVFDEGGFKRGFEPDDAALVDVGLLLFLRGLLDVDVVQVLAIDDRHAQFFSLRGIDQHTLHGGFLTRSYREERRGPRPMFRAWGALRTRAWQELPALQTLGVPTGALVLFVRS